MRVFVLLVALLFAAPAFAQDVLSPSAFRDEGISRMRAMDPSVQITIKDDLSIEIRRSDAPGDSFTANFDNSYFDYQNDPSRMAEILDRLARVALSPPEDGAFDRGRLVSVVRGHDRVAGYQGMYGQMDPPQEFLVRPFAGDLFEVLVFDSAEAVAIAPRQNLEALGLTDDQAWQLGRANIATRMGETTASTYDEAPRGVAWVAGGNGLAPSALLQPQICTGTPGDLFLVTGREGFWRASARDPSAIEFLRGFAAHLIDTQQSESSTLLTCRNEQLTAE